MIKFFTILITACSLFLSISCGSSVNNDDNDQSTDIMPYERPIGPSDDPNDGTSDDTNDGTSDDTSDGAPDGIKALNYIGDMTFITNANGTITQNPLNLIWRQTDEVQASTILEAVSRCESLTADDREWRLPAVFEFISVTDYSNIDLSKDEVNLTGTYWINSLMGSNQLKYTDNGRIELRDPTDTTPINVRCVSGTVLNTDYIYPEDRWQVKTLNDAEVVTDSITGLLWESEVSDSVNVGFQVTLDSNCTDKTIAGLTGWRVPTVQELLSLLDLRKTDKPYINSAFSQKRVFVFSSDQNIQYLAVDFSAFGDVVFPSQNAGIKCVRNSQN